MSYSKQDIERRMEGALASLATEFSGLRTGRASVNLLDSIKVPAYGGVSPLSQVASVTVTDTRMLSVNVWDKTVVAAVDRAIRESGLGVHQSRTTHGRPADEQRKQAAADSATQRETPVRFD